MATLSLLDIITDVCDLGGLQRPLSVINSDDATIRQLLAIANDKGQEMARLHDFPQLCKAASLTLIAQEIQPLPAEVAEILSDTAWYAGDMSPLVGALTWQEWQQITQTVAASTKFFFRIAQTTTGGRGLAFNPIPTGGEVVNYFYRSKSWAKPKDWIANASVIAGEYVYSDSQYWQASASGTAGTSTPTTANSGNDGGIVWVPQANIIYDRFIADSDESLLDPNILKKGILARFYRMKGWEFQDLEAEYYAAMKDDLGERYGGRSFNLMNGRGRFISELNIKEGNW